MKPRETFETGNEPEFLIQDLHRAEMMGDGLWRVTLTNMLGGGLARTQLTMMLTDRAAVEIGRELVRLGSQEKREGELVGYTPAALASMN